MSGNMMTKKDDVPQMSVSVEAGYHTSGGFDLVQRIAGMFSKSTLVPDVYKGSIANCAIALEMAQRIGASPLMTMQNMYIVHGRPAWSSQFLISCLNASGRFSPIRYEITGNKSDDSWGCIAWAKDLADGEVLKGPEVTIAMSKNEGWFGKKGSKWQTMPDLMLRYRAATFFARLYAPELTMGIRTQEEAHEIKAADVAVSGPAYAEPSFENEPVVPVEPEADEPKEAPPTAKKEKVEKPAPKKVEQPAPAESKDLTPVEDMAKAGLVAEMKIHSANKYYSAVLEGFMPPGETDYTKCGASQLRDIVADMRKTQEDEA